jgi:hypothetical protein
METSDTLRTPELAEILTDASYRQVNRVARELIPGYGRAIALTPAQVHRFQVADALASPVQVAERLSPFPAIARAVFAYPHDPEAGTWAIYKEQSVCYVHYSADLARFIGKAALTAKIDRLWPDKEEGDDDAE